jgi:hypothetical protein
MTWGWRSSGAGRRAAADARGAALPFTLVIGFIVMLRAGAAALGAWSVGSSSCWARPWRRATCLSHALEVAMSVSTAPKSPPQVSPRLVVGGFGRVVFPVDA